MMFYLSRRSLKSFIYCNFGLRIYYVPIKSDKTGHGEVLPLKLDSPKILKCLLEEAVNLNDY